jgi:hypothetical protein
MIWRQLGARPGRLRPGADSFRAEQENRFGAMERGCARRVRCPSPAQLCRRVCDDRCKVGCHTLLSCRGQHACSIAASRKRCWRSTMLSVSLQAELHSLQERAAQEGRYVVDPAEAGCLRLPGRSCGRGVAPATPRRSRYPRRRRLMLRSWSNAFRNRAPPTSAKGFFFRDGHAAQADTRRTRDCHRQVREQVPTRHHRFFERVSPPRGAQRALRIPAVLLQSRCARARRRCRMCAGDFVSTS